MLAEASRQAAGSDTVTVAGEFDPDLVASVEGDLPAATLLTDGIRGPLLSATAPRTGAITAMPRPTTVAMCSRAQDDEMSTATRGSLGGSRASAVTGEPRAVARG
mgnify:CR=1 FL=1